MANTSEEWVEVDRWKVDAEMKPKPAGVSNASEEDEDEGILFGERRKEEKPTPSLQMEDDFIVVDEDLNSVKESLKETIQHLIDSEVSLSLCVEQSPNKKVSRWSDTIDPDAYREYIAEAENLDLGLEIVNVANTATPASVAATKTTRSGGTPSPPNTFLKATPINTSSENLVAGSRLKRSISASSLPQIEDAENAPKPSLSTDAVTNAVPSLTRETRAKSKAIGLSMQRAGHSAGSAYIVSAQPKYLKNNALQFIFQKLNELELLSSKKEGTGSARIKALPSFSRHSKFIPARPKNSSHITVKKKSVEFQTSIEAILHGALQISRKAHPLLDVQWAYIFYHRMLTCENILSKSTARHYLALMKEYLNLSIETPEVDLRTAAETLSSYITLHDQDPDNSLIGKVPSKAIQKQLQFLELIPKFMENPSDICGSTIYTKEFLSKKLAIWSEMPNDKAVEIVDQLKELYKSIQAEEQWERAWESSPAKSGSLLCVRLTKRFGPADNWRQLQRLPSHMSFGVDCHPSTYIYARFTGVRRGNQIEILTTPDERSKQFVRAYQAVPAVEAVIDALGDAEKMQKITDDPMVTFWEEFDAKVLDYTQNYLQKQSSVDAASLAKLETEEKNEQRFLKKLRIQLENTLSTVGNDLAERDAEEAKKINKFLDSLDDEIVSRQIYPPTRTASIRKTQGLSFANSVKSKIVWYLERCEKQIADFVIPKTEQITGSKQELTAWWLELIEEAVNKFLLSRGYNMTAIPEKYIDVPPASVSEVSKNLKLVQEILNPNEDKHNVQALLDNLKGQIYPRINEFIKNVQIALCEYFDLDTVTYSTAQIKAAFATKKTRNQQVNDWIDNTIKDLEYLERLRSLEMEKQERGAADFHIVPITGLILGTFVRYENELKTVLEVWGQRSIKQAEPIEIENPGTSSVVSKLNLEIKPSDKQPSPRSPRNSPRGSSPRPSSVHVESVVPSMPPPSTINVVTTVTVASAAGKVFTVYLVEIIDVSGRKTTILKRYREFDKLQNKLLKKYSKSQLPKLPKKHFINNLDANLVQRRCKKLEKYLRELAKIPNIFKNEHVYLFFTESSHTHSSQSHS